jgi:hypothetical protein
MAALQAPARGLQLATHRIRSDVGDGAEVRIVADLDFVEPDYG